MQNFSEKVAKIHPKRISFPIVFSGNVITKFKFIYLFN